MTGVLTTAAVLSATLFTSWALYITLVEHPARLDSGADAGRAQFGPSYRRAAPWQASFAATALVSGVAAAGLTSRWAWLAGALVVGSVIPLTLLVIRPINRRLLAPGRLDDHETLRLLRHCGALHTVRTTLGAAGLLAFLWALGTR